MLYFILPFPPSVNSYWRQSTRSGRPCAILSAKGRQYKKDVMAAIKRQLGRVEPITRPVIVELCYHRPDNRTRDLDNGIKAVFDAITNARVWQDDSLVHDFHPKWAENWNYASIPETAIPGFCVGKGTVEIAISVKGAKQ